MGVEKDGSRPGGYVGGFFQLFDWKAKSRKKLFSSKSESQERSKQVKKHDGNLPMTQIYMMEEDVIGFAPSVKGHSDYSCSSSVTEDDGYGSKAPNVVARLMGLDSMPTTNSSDPYSSPFYDGLSLRSEQYLQRNHDHRKMHSVDLLNEIDVLMKDQVVPKSQRTVHRPIEKFQTEILPPKSAKSIPITHHKLLSPIKSPGFFPSKNAAHIMEAAARIIEPGPSVPLKAKTSLLVGSPSVHLKVRDFKEKVEATQRLQVFGSSTEDLKGQDIKEKMDIDQKTLRPSETSRKTFELSSNRYLKGQPMDKSWNGTDALLSRASSSSVPESSSGAKNKGKSISLAIQAKVNVQRREGLSSTGGRSSVGQQEVSENKSSQPFRIQLHAQRSSQKKPLSSNSSAVLRQNNQKQNCLLDKQKLPRKNSGSSLQGQKVISNTSSGREKTVKSVGNSKTTRKLEAIDNESEALRSNVKRSLRKKRSIDANFQFEKNWAVSGSSSEKNKKPVQPTNAILEKNHSRGESSKKKGMDVVSFTFTTPLTRPLSNGETSAHATPDIHGLCSDYYGNRSLSSLDTMKSSLLHYNFIGGDALSLLLEQKLKEFTLDSASSHSDPASTSSCASSSQDLVQPMNAESSAPVMHGNYKQNVLPKDKLRAQSETDLFTPNPPLSRLKQEHQGNEMEGSNGNSLEGKLYIDTHNPSPVSTLAPLHSMESCISSDSTDSNNMEGYRQSLSVQALEILKMNNFGKSSSAMDLDLTDSATSGCNSAYSYNPTDLSMTNEGELEYVKEILSNVELMFKDYSLGRACEIINPHLFEHLEARKGVTEHDDGESRLQHKLLFDCIRECLDLRCSKYIGGGCITWAKGLAIMRRKERLAEDVYKEISGWKGMRDCMVDDLVDKDMSSQYGRWLDFEADGFELGVEIEAEILAGLVDDALADILLM